jgi:TolB protein
MNMDGGDVRRLTHKMDIVDTDINPKTSDIVFSSNCGENERQIFTVTADGSRLREITSALGQARGPVWSPDGTHIAFSSRRGDTQAIYVVGADGKDERKVSSGSGQDTNPAWSPDGQQIAFVRVNVRAKGAYVCSASSLWSVALDGCTERELVTATALHGYPSWCPDGRKIAFVSNLSRDDQFYRVCVVDADGGNLRRVAIQSTASSPPAWNPDGSMLAFSGNESAHDAGLYVVDVMAGTCQQLVSRAWTGVPRWSPDGKRIAVSSYRNSRYGIYLIDVADKNERRLATSDDTQGVKGFLLGGGRVTH